MTIILDIAHFKYIIVRMIVFLDAFTTFTPDLDLTDIMSLPDFKAYPRASISDDSIEWENIEIAIVNKFIINQYALERMSGLKYIIVSATGYNNIDISATLKKGIPISNIKNYSTQSVVQHVFAMLLNYYNKVEYYNLQIENKRWQKSQDFCFYDHSIPDLSTKTFGVVGYGAIGRNICAVAQAFGANVVVYNRSQIDRLPSAVTQVDLISLFQSCDIISLHVPLNDMTRHMINKESLSYFKKTAVLINTSRGPLINENDLFYALDHGTLEAALVDVLSEEPPSSHNILMHHPRCFVTPHIAWANIQARQNLVNQIVHLIRSYFDGEIKNRVVS